MVPFTKLPFWYHFFEPQPNQEPGTRVSMSRFHVSRTEAWVSAGIEVRPSADLREVPAIPRRFRFLPFRTVMGISDVETDPCQTSASTQFSDEVSLVPVRLENVLLAGWHSMASRSSVQYITKSRWRLRRASRPAPCYKVFARPKSPPLATLAGFSGKGCMARSRVHGAWSCLVSGT